MSAVFEDPSFKNLYKNIPIILLDIGASEGIPKRWEIAKAFVKAVGFEPDIRAFKNLVSSDSAVYINTAISNVDGNIAINLTKKQTCSSIFTPNYDFVRQFPDAQRFEIEGSVTLSGKQLNKKLLQNNGITDPDFMKTDIQGGELKVFQGAEEILDGSIFGIEVEVEFNPIYTDQPLFADIDDYLRSRGFSLFDLRRYFWKRSIGSGVGGAKGQIIFADALYLKTYEALSKSMQGRTAEEKKAKILKAILICRIYGLDDYALYLCENAFNDHILPVQDKEILFRSLGAGRRKNNFIGKTLLAKLFRHIYIYAKALNDRFKPNENYFVDEELGNK